MDIDTKKIFSSSMHGIDIFQRCRKLVLKSYLLETKQIKFYKYEKNREIGEKNIIYELNSLVSIVFTNLLL